MQTFFPVQFQFNSIQFIANMAWHNTTSEQQRCKTKTKTEKIFLVMRIDVHVPTSQLRPALSVTGHEHSHLPPTAPPPDLRRPQRVLRHEKLGNSVTWPAWENWNAFLFNRCLYSSEIDDCKSPWPHKCTTIFCFYNPDLPDAIICQSWICQR